MTLGQDVLRLVDDVIVCASRAPVLFARMSRANASAVEFLTHYELAVAGIPTPHIAHLDSDATTRRRHVRRRRNHVARKARRVNR